MGDDARHGIAAAMVLAEHLGEEAPDGRDRAEHPVPVLDTVFVEGVEDAGLGQDVGERQALVRVKRARSRSRLILGSAWMSRGGTIEIASVGKGW